MKENNTEFINEWSELIKSLKEYIKEKFDEYINECNNELCCISIYLKVRFRDGIGINNFVEELYVLFKDTCSKYNIDEDSLINRVAILSEKYINSDNYYNIIDKEIKVIMSELLERSKK